jgi:hypothetical protein
VAQHPSKKQSHPPLTGKKELKLKMQLAKALAGARSVADAAGASLNVNAFKTAVLASAAAGAAAHESKTNTYSAVPKVVVTSDSEVSDSASVACSVSEASVPSRSPPFSPMLSEGESDLLHGRPPSLRQHCPNSRKQQCPREFEKEVWLQVIKSYKDHRTEGCKLKFGDDVAGWAGKPESSRLCDGIDISQVAKITTSEVFENTVHQSVSSTLFASTPQNIRQDCLEAVQEGLASKAITVYFWKTGSSRNRKLFGIQCTSCLTLSMAHGPTNPLRTQLTV